MHNIWTNAISRTCLSWLPDEVPSWPQMLAARVSERGQTRVDKTVPEGPGMSALGVQLGEVGEA